MNLFTLTRQLNAGAYEANTGSGLIRAVAIVSFTLSSWIALLVASGTWMFYQRAENPFGNVDLLHQSIEMYNILYQWFGLALFACIFVVPAILSLTSQAAILGATGREQRFAVLRLLGLRAADVRRMTVIETGGQALLGLALASALYVLSLPWFTHVSFQGEPIRIEELLMPWWGYVAVAFILIFLALGASWWAMQRVNVNPLGVSKREIPPALKATPLLVGIAVGIAVVIFVNNHTFRPEIGLSVAILIPVVIMVAIVNLISPYLLQLSAKIAQYLPGNAHFVATQRVKTDAKTSWRRVSVMAFMGFLAGFIATVPLTEIEEYGEAAYSTMVLFDDSTTGIMLTLIFSYLLTMVSVFLAQATSIYESADLAQSLHRLGVKREFQTRVALWETLGPMVVTSLLGFALSTLQGFLLFQGVTSSINPGRLLLALALLVLGWITTALAMVAVEPLRTRVLNRVNRKE